MLLLENIIIKLWIKQLLMSNKWLSKYETLFTVFRASPGFTKQQGNTVCSDCVNSDWEVSIQILSQLQGRKKKEKKNTYRYNNTLIPLLSPSRSVTIGRYCDIFWFNASGFNFATDFWHILSPKKLIPTVINTQCDLCLID